jgi:uncharacterized membrane protein YdjX (TVP38/TMEM64 family)
MTEAPSSAVDSPLVGETAPIARRPWLRPVLLLAALAAVYFAAPALGVGERIAELRGWIVGLGPLGPAVFVVVYALAAILAIPASLLTVAAGAMFGSVVGVSVVAIGATLGATAAFAIARWLARDAIAVWLEGNEKFRRLDELTGRHGAVIVAITRLVPLFPFNLLNYGFGLTRVPFSTYVFWSFVCMLPGTVLYVVGADALSSGLAEGRVPWTLLAVLAAVLGLLSLLVRRARRVLAEREAAAHPETRP